MIFYRSWQGVEALSFDLDDTLYDNHPYIMRAEQWLQDTLKHEVFETANLRPSDWQAYKRRVLAKQPELIHDVSACRVAWLSLGFAELGVAEPEALAEDIFERFVAVRSDFTVPQASLDLLKQLATRFRLLAITNGNVDLDKIGLGGVFELVLKAGEGRRAKPAADLYDYAAEQMQLEPEQIAHIGDHCRTDVKGAVNAGYKAIWYNHQGCQRRALSNLPDLEIHDIEQLRGLLN